MGAKVRYIITFFGDVQGVGFRFTACHAAQAYSCTGWVRNEYDGSVTMEIQGTEAEINKVLERIEKGCFISIDRIDKKSIATVDDEWGFDTKW
ncbi:MAG: acylphosphatase [Lachnospiraceae bacterium]|nr:acylphosphatase [Lachnospiraceae bacterium]